MTKIIPAIMSGGAGTRLWPVSTQASPKQFHRLAGPDTMIQATAARFTAPACGLGFAAPLVICGAGHRDLVHDQLAAAGISAAGVILEPMGRGTAATALLAAEAAAAIDPEALVLLLPADHVIEDTPAFHAALAAAAPAARERIVTFGIEPTGPETGYGYIEMGAGLAGPVRAITRFREKPDRATAGRMLAAGGHVWNAGIFLFAPATVRAEFALAPQIRDGVLAALAAARHDGTDIWLPADAFAAVPAQAFDVAIMERTAQSAVLPCAFGWADVGSWSELWRLSAGEDPAAMVLRGQAVAEASSGCLVIGDGVPVAVHGVEDLIVVATPHGVLVLPKGEAQRTKDLLAALKASGFVQD